MNNINSYENNCVLFRSDIDSQEEYDIAESIFHDQIVRYRTSVQPNSLVVGRYSVLPWYLELEAELKLHNSRLINTHTEHSWIADVTAWAGDKDHYKKGDLSKFTPKTWTTWSKLPDNMSFIVKGRTNSRKWKWNTHMFAKDKTDLLTVTGRLLDDNFISEQGLVVREYVPLRTFDHGLNGLPITNEWRCFFVGNELISRGFYWANMPEIFDQAEWTPEAERFMYQVAEAAAKFACFFVLDIAQREDGSWVLIEVNDGQMSGLSLIDPVQFYTKLNTHLKPQDPAYGKKRYRPSYQEGVGMKANPALHANSKELVEVLKKNNVLFDDISIFEIGSGPGRNLKYILDECPSANIASNDLYEFASKEHMHETVKDKIKFFEADTLNLMNDVTFDMKIDLLISSDHLMHVQKENVIQILNQINNRIAPTWILLRERKKRYEDLNVATPRLYHDYSVLDTNYETIDNLASKQDGRYFIRLYKRRNV